jgi:hypothetical protein
MSLETTVILTFSLMGLCALAAAVWSVWFPLICCQKIRTNTDSEYNICIRHKNHDGPHMAADGEKFR